MRKPFLSWNSLFLLTFLAAYLYVFNEWLFAVTKPHFMNDLSLARQLQIFLVLGALLVSLCFLSLLPLLISSLFPFLRRYTNLIIKLGGLLPAMVFAILILIMVDNFTYTVFKWGIVSSKGWTRGLYGLGFLLTIFLCYRSVLKALLRLSWRNRIWGMAPKRIFRLLAGALVLSFSLLALSSQKQAASLSTDKTAKVKQRPHILVLTADGMDATHTSIYGYERDTTPHLRALAKSSLVAENAFANAGKSPGSVVSMYTSKYPAQTRMLFTPDILQGTDAYEHLPGILRSQGYKTVQITVPYYLDARILNIVDGFDEIKMSSAAPSELLTRIGKVLPSDHALFADEILKRAVDRIRHIFFIRQMENPYLQVTAFYARRVDIERWVYLRQELQTAKQPLFVHVHAMVTHGQDFFPMEQNFSLGQSIADQQPWSDDFYDDSILDFDKNVGELVNELMKLGLLENTILIIGSDHGKQWDQLHRLPLIIRFPHGQYAGRVQANVQNLDIAPTLLDYLGLDQPDWMRGQSLIASELDQRPIFGVSSVETERVDDSRIIVIPEKVKPPFYQFGDISLIYCQTWYKLDLTNLGWKTGNVEGSTAACPPGSEISEQQAFEWIVQHLEENGFDVSSLENLTPWIH
ncbi:MAG TPA: sulfatase-like hydrolase/transferase [Anaerolineales bacterium]|nr:sulfatase-like hydrolase/transferase [Anaerolineales bacterium]